MIYSTIWSDDPGWNDAVSVIDWRRTGTAGLYRQVASLGRHDVLVVNGALGWDARWRDLAAAVAARAARRRFAVVVSDATWLARSVPAESRARAAWGAAAGLTRWLDRRLVGGRTTFCFLSTAEVADFEGATGGRAVFTPFMTSLPGTVEPPAPACTRSGRAGRRRFVFTGGNTLRDWDLLCDALADLVVDDEPVRVRVATRHTERAWPANFDVGPCSEPEFFDLAGSAAVGVLALQGATPRSCGQQTYLNLLRLGTPVVVNDAAGVADHLSGVPAARVVAASDPGAMRSAVTDLLDPSRADQVAEEAASAQEVMVERFAPSVYLGRLLRIAEELAAGA